MPWRRVTEGNLIRRLLKNRPWVIKFLPSCLVKSLGAFLPIELLNDCCVLTKMSYTHQALIYSFNATNQHLQ